ncbi:MAG: hypothetical protein CMQ24_22075 [Gammaproteobacteria bacterium]|nr:hypothetical protein [Gammaproteobacteria bacterium]
MDKFEQQLTELRVFGFCIVENVLDASVVGEMRDTLVEAAARLGVESTHRGSARHLANLVTIDPIYFQAVDHARILPLVEAIMGHDLILGSLSARIVRPGDGLQSLHSDVPLGLHRHQPDPPVMMNTIWALDDFTPGNGGTRVVPGSHQSRLHEPPAGFDVPFVAQPELRAGSVLVIHGQTWHGGGANTSTGNRHAMFGHYRVDAWMRFQCDPHHQFEEPWLDLLTDRQRELLRMQHGLSDKLAADFYER